MLLSDSTGPHLGLGRSILELFCQRGDLTERERTGHSQEGRFAGNRAAYLRSEAKDPHLELLCGHPPGLLLAHGHLVRSQESSRSCSRSGEIRSNLVGWEKDRKAPWSIERGD